MKKMFTKMFQMSLFNHILRLAIVVLCLSYSVAALGGSQDYYSAVKVTITGGGKVYVKPEGNNSETRLTSTGVVAGKKTESWGMPGSDPGRSSNHSYTVRADASGTNYYFSGWKDGNEIKSQDPSYTFTIASTSYKNEEDAKNMPKEIQAIFNPYISISDKINFIVYPDGIDIVKFDIKDIYKRESLTLTLRGDDADKFLLGKTDADIKHSSITLGTAEGLSATATTDCSIYLNYSYGAYDPEEALAIGNNTYLEITDNDSHTWTVPIRTTAPETFTFLAGQGGKYTVVFANADKTTISNIISDQDPTYLRSDMYTLASLTATPNSGYKFFGWQTVDENGVGTYFSYDSQVLNKAFVGGTIIRPLFIPSTQATFIIKEDPNKTPYYDLQEALDVAKKKGYSTVVFNAPTKGTTGTLSPRSGGDAYVIPEGVTLLIPGEGTYRCRTTLDKNYGRDDFIAGSSSSNYSKLILNENTKILLDGGNLSIYATISQTQNYNGMPLSYGWIEMGKNCSISTVAGKASTIYAMGYITGDVSSSVTLDDGSTAFESFQFTDFRGGMAMVSIIGMGEDMINNKNRVFPVQQYYVQNIEAPMTIKWGATLKAIGVVHIRFEKGITIDEQCLAAADLLAKAAGFVYMTQNVDIHRIYDTTRDVMQYTVKGSGSEKSTAQIGNIYLDLGIVYGTDLKMDTKGFVMPIANNMEMILDGLTVESPNYVGLLAGSKVWIKENAVMKVEAPLYVYDREENKVTFQQSGAEAATTTGFYGAGNSELIPIVYTPNKSHLLQDGKTKKRTKENIASAEIKVDGTLTVKDAGLYTTVSGAGIVSSKNNAVIRFEKGNEVNESTKLYQARQSGSQIDTKVEYPEILITPAKLKNSDGTYVETIGAAVEYQYYATAYDADGNVSDGIWSLPPAKVKADTWNASECKATMPTTPVPMTVSCQVENVTSANYKDAFVGRLDGAFAFANGDLANSVSLNDNILSISVKYTPQDNTKDDHTATLTLINKQIQTEEFTYTTTLTATEEYIPDFSIDKSDITLVTKTGSAELKKAFTITPTEKNVATLSSTEGLVWSYQILNGSEGDDVNTSFGYTQGTISEGKIENNAITFNSTVSGTQYARLIITATYTPKNQDGAKSISKTINLIGTQLEANTLEFDMPEEIRVTDKNVPVLFKNKYNTSAITVTLTENGEEGAPVAELVGNNGTYYINALRAGVFTLQATQSDDANVAGITKTYTITINKLTPDPVWNWGTVYGNQSYSNPFDPATVVEGQWTLTETSDPSNALAYDEAIHTVQVMNVDETKTAEYTFEQKSTEIYGKFTQSYLVTINPDPRILTLVVDNKAKYDIVVANAHSDGVSCNESGMITLPAKGYVIVQFIGVPHEAWFSLTGNTTSMDVIVEENADMLDTDSWKVMNISDQSSKWAFSQTHSACLKITNNSDKEIVLYDLTITEKAGYQRNVFYAKASVGVYPIGAGMVSAKGSYSDFNIDTETNNEDVFVSWTEFKETTLAHAMLHEDKVSISGDLRFSLQAKSVPGYYFISWTVEDNYLVTEKLLWSDRTYNYEMSFTLPYTYTFKGYSFDTYVDLFCQQNQDICQAAKPESGEPSQAAVAYRNAGALALIPATQVGTWQANFELAQVVSAEDAVWDEVTSPNASDVAKHDVVFDILGDDPNDFVATLEENKGFSFAESDIKLSTTYDTYTINTSYTPQDVHGEHTATLTLARVNVEGVSEESKKTITLTATENLEPYFKLADANFGDGTLGQETIIDITPTDKNTVAQVLDPTKLHWEASLETGSSFEVISVADDGTCKVRYFRKTPGNQLATLTIKATYTDSEGTPIPFSKTCTLTGSSTAEKAANTLALKQDIVLYVDDEPISLFSNLDANNTEGITINLPEGCTALAKEGGMIKPSGNFTTGTFTITVKQAENDYFQASSTLTTKVTVKKHTPEVTWNWTDLYFGQTYTVPVTTNSNGARTIIPIDDHNIVKYDLLTETVIVDPLTEGEYEVIFSVAIAESDLYEAYSSQNYTAIVYKDPRHVRVDVNSELTYRAVTIADRTGENVSFHNGGIHFADVAGSEYESRQWTMYFIGVPDQLFFTPSGNNAWEIRESSNGSNWLTTFASSQLPVGEQFAMSLSPNTTHVRILYATNADAPSNGVLNSFYITALEGVKANVDGLYMPIAVEVVNSPTTKQVELQYTSQEKLTITTSDPQFTVDVAELPALNVDEYAEQIVTITSKATQEKEGRIYVKNAAGDILLELPIYTFIFPQTLPIQLATDEPQRFYYVTTASKYVKWDMNTRVVTLQNALANTTRSLTFAFNGAPTLLRYNHTAGDRGIWTIRESANNTDWYDADPTTRVVSGNEIEQGLLSTTRYVQVVYTSPYSEKVEVTNLIIVGDASVTTDVNVLEFTETQPTSTLNVTAINLADFNVQIDNEHFTVTSLDKSALTGTGIVDVPVGITWTPTAAVEYATLTIVNPNADNTVLATVELVGKKQSISGPTNIGIYTGLAEDITEIKGTFEGTDRCPIDLTNAFDAATQTKALFDYLFIYGETSTMDGSTTITTPNSQRGSNAKTPCYIYQREGDTYKLLKVVDNVNDQDKAWSGAIPVPVSDIPTRVYITGFAPYASTGYTKEEEGVWCFRGQAGSKLDVYLEDAYIYSRYKTIDGHSFIDRDNGEAFSEKYARGSGGVLVFECSSVNNTKNPFEVNIHTKDRNLLKSHYGCFLSSIVGRAFQVSSPIQVHMVGGELYVNGSYTTLSFDDIWPTAITRTATEGVVTAEDVSVKRTNGFISLQKQVNNAPSIDLGNPNTVVNFNGGQVELQNAQNVSDNYKTTLAISYRGGKFAGYHLAYGVGSDEVTGTVNFKDGTTTVIPMEVDERYRQYYLMDEDNPNTQEDESLKTTCLRCPQNTYVYGGSHCMMRACNEPTSKGGAPWSHAGEGAVRLGMYRYPYASYTTVEGDDVVTHAGGWTLIEGANGLVQIPEEYIPNIKVGDQVARRYGVASVMPNDNGTPDVAKDDYLNFWVPAGYDDSVTPEVDLKVSYWKAAMTRIAAQYASYGGEVGGNIKIGDDTEVETELVYNLLYCVLDEDIKTVLRATEEIDGNLVHSYAAPVKHPAGAGYLEIRPSEVGTDDVNYVENMNSYKVQNRVYYVTPIPSADNWMTFTAPFDVDNIYVVETYMESELSAMGTKAEIKIEQARHNADFAAFFGVAMALGSDRDFNDIYADYIGWAKLQDVGKYTGQYNLRGKHELEYYDGTNWATANYYLYENQGEWAINADYEFTTQWTLPDLTDDILMNKGKSYSLLFPYCTGCWEYDKNGNLIPRTMWDYWSGKFIIFESTLRSEDNPHELDGVNTVQDDIVTYTPSAGTAYVLGNTSLGKMTITSDYLFEYNSTFPMEETFDAIETETFINPTNTFLLGNIPTDEHGISAYKVRRDGKIIYGPSGNGDGNGDNPGTGTHTPTVGGGHDLFITAISGGINVAVAYPQHVRVLSATGAVLYSGMVQTSVDVLLPTDGIYIVSGEKEVQKILY